MIYFSIENDMVIKNEVLFDKEEIIKIREKIINKCSLIKHIEYKTNTPPSSGETSTIIIKNYKQIPNDKHDGYWKEPSFKYIVSYDEYTYPVLVKLLDRLLVDDPSVMDDILYKHPDKHFDMEGIIKNKMAQVKSIPLSNTLRRSKAINQLNNWLEIQKLNENQEPVQKYYDLLSTLIILKPVASISKEDFDRMQNFLEFDSLLNNANTRKRTKNSRK